jgi:hypothetical protein
LENQSDNLRGNVGVDGTIILMDAEEIERERVGWIFMTGWIQWRALVNTAVVIRVSYSGRDLATYRISTSQEGLCCSDGLLLLLLLLSSSSSSSFFYN